MKKKITKFEWFSTGAAEFFLVIGAIFLGKAFEFTWSSQNSLFVIGIILIILSISFKCAFEKYVLETSSK
jgi:hypothetical protein